MGGKTVSPLTTRGQAEQRKKPMARKNDRRGGHSAKGKKEKAK